MPAELRCSAPHPQTRVAEPDRMSPTTLIPTENLVIISHAPYPLNTLKSRIPCKPLNIFPGTQQESRQ
jgi:hypothetical protein